MARRSRPSTSTAPEQIRPDRGEMRPRMDINVALLPDPDSPTMHSVSPWPTENDTSSTACTAPSRLR
jgi:hypothetical protein